MCIVQYVGLPPCFSYHDYNIYYSLHSSAMDLFGDDVLFAQFEETAEAGLSEQSDDDDASSHNEEYQELLSKYNSLKESLRHFSGPANIKVKDPTRDGPIAHVILFNHAISRKYHSEIKDFFRNLCLRQEKSNDNRNTSDIQPTFIQYPQPEKEFRHKKSSKHAEAKTKAFQAFSSVHLYENFCLDLIGEPFDRKDYKFCCSNQTQYEPSQFDPLVGNNEIASAVKKKIQRICFNCGKSDHQMKDCDKKRDFKAINERRKKFDEEVAKINGGTSRSRIDGGRYHKDDDDSNKERFAKFQPGVVSSELQKALGMNEDDLPPYIYHMRVLGYPPGHLHNAQIVDSGLSLFEEGELDGGGTTNGYIPVDVNKIISFPGFNTPPLPGQVDKFRKFNVPPMDTQHCKENMVSYFEKRNELYYKRKAAENERENDLDKNRGDADTMEVDMETEHTADESDNAIKSSRISANMTDDAKEDDVGIEMDIFDGDVGSLTEDELEVKREMLLKQLQQQESASQDSDYRDIVGKDQDYRKFDEVITIADSSSDAALSSPIIIEDDNAVEMSPIKDSPDSPSPENAGDDDPCVKTVSPEHPSPSTDTLESADVALLKGERNSSSDTDYRLHQQLEPTITVENEPAHASKQDSDIAEKSSNMVNDDGDRRLPDREKFAEGISQFDRYYEETKPQGTYLKLKELLKDSPRRQEK